MAKIETRTVRTSRGDIEKKGSKGSRSKRKVTSQGLSKNTRMTNKNKRRQNGNKSKVK